MKDGAAAGDKGADAGCGEGVLVVDECCCCCCLGGVDARAFASLIQALQPLVRYGRVCSREAVRWDGSDDGMPTSVAVIGIDKCAELYSVSLSSDGWTGDGKAEDDNVCLALAVQ